MVRTPIGRGVHDDVLADDFGDGSFDLLASEMIGKGVVRVGDVQVGHQAALMSNGLESVCRVGDGDFQVLAATVPTELLNEQGLEVEVR